MNHDEELSDLIATLRTMQKSVATMRKQSAASADFSLTKSRRNNANESARESAIEIRRLKHIAHCLAVSIGIADRRADSEYTDSTAPAGFGRTVVFSRPAPSSSTTSDGEPK